MLIDTMLHHPIFFQTDNRQFFKKRAIKKVRRTMLY